MNKIIELLSQFRDERDWLQFHNSKDLALAISIESNELLAEFLWKGHDEANLVEVRKELADVMIYCLYLCDRNNWNPEQIILEKLEENVHKYPVEREEQKRKEKKK